jgi:hypothetical protein
MKEGGSAGRLTGACGIPVHRVFHDHDFCNLLEEHRDGKNIDRHPSLNYEFQKKELIGKNCKNSGRLGTNPKVLFTCFRACKFG